MPCHPATKAATTKTYNWPYYLQATHDGDLQLGHCGRARVTLARGDTWWRDAQLGPHFAVWTDPGLIVKQSDSPERVGNVADLLLAPIPRRR